MNKEIKCKDCDKPFTGFKGIEDTCPDCLPDELTKVSTIKTLETEINNIQVNKAFTIETPKGSIRCYKFGDSHIYDDNGWEYYDDDETTKTRELLTEKETEELEEYILDISLFEGINY